MPKFEFASTLQAIQDYEINTLFLVGTFASMRYCRTDNVKVPPIIILMTKNKPMLEKYNLTSVWSLFTGAAPLGKETAEDLQNIFPSWKIRQGYGE